MGSAGPTRFLTKDRSLPRGGGLLALIIEQALKGTADSLGAVFCLQALAQFCLRVLAVEPAAAASQLNKRESLFRHVFHDRKRGSD